MVHATNGAVTLQFFSRLHFVGYNSKKKVHIHTLHYITLHYIPLHYTTLHYITLHYITLHYITLLTYIHTYIHAYIHTYIHTHTHIHKHIHIHIYIYYYYYHQIHSNSTFPIPTSLPYLCILLYTVVYFCHFILQYFRCKISRNDDGNSQHSRTAK